VIQKRQKKHKIEKKTTMRSATNQQVQVCQSCTALTTRP